MSKIKIMTDELSNRIAAGEVIERPASVVKELVENAIDAGATRIRITVERAGTRLISVADDGCGMDADDALMCLEPHGTSKLFSADGIEHIATLGFRGEAMPSIASVSRLSLLTRTRDNVEGTFVRIEGGKLLSSAPAGGPVGTTIQVRDLFFNTPARRKFMKSDATESHHIEECVLAMSLPRWEIGFELIVDGRSAINSPGGASPEPRMREFFGRAYADNLRQVDHHEDGMHIYGYIAAPGFTRNARREQRTFINRRAVESPTLYRGIRDGYGALAESGRFPPTLIFIDLPPEEVDVNVHPAKREVRFRRDYAVARAVAAAVARTLRGSAEAAQNAEPPDELPLSGKVPLKLVLAGAEIAYHPSEVEQPELEPVVTIPPGSEERNAEDLGRLPLPPSTPMLTDRPMPADAPPVELSATAPPVAAPRQEVPDFSANGEFPQTVLGVYDDTYILAAGPHGLVLIDQHAAHERVMFERLLDQAAHGAPSQPLLLPETLELPRNNCSLLLKYRKIFEQLGFDFEPMGSCTIMLNALPAAIISKRPLTELIPDMLGEILDNSENHIPVEPAYVARAACRAAVKAHETLPLELARQLLRELAACRQGTLCPHGRPTLITIKLSEIEKRFGRR